MQADTPLLPYALCSPEDVAGLIQQTAPKGEQLETLVRLINFFSEMVQGPQFLNRELARKSRTEYFDVDTGFWTPLVAHPDWFQVKAPPISVNTDDPPVPTVQVWNSSERVYDAGSLLVLYTDYAVTAERGIVHSVAGCWQTGARAIKVIYTGGLVDPPANAQGRPTGPADLRAAAAMQVAAWFQRKKDLGVDSMSFPQGGAIQLSDPTKLLMNVKQTLSRYRVFRGVS